MRRLDDGGREAGWEATGVPRQREMEPQAQVVRVGGGKDEVESRQLRRDQ